METKTLKTEQIHIRIDTELKTKAQVKAIKDNKNLSKLIIEFLKQYVEE